MSAYRRGIGVALAIAGSLVATNARADDPPPLPPPDAPPTAPAPADAQPAPPPPPYVVVEPAEPLPPIRPAPAPYEVTVPPYEFEPKPLVRRTMIGLDTHIWSAERSGTGMPMVPFFTAALSSYAALDVRLPMAFGFPSGGGSTVAAMGNPTLTLSYAPTSEGLTWFIGGRLAMPIASAGDSPEWGAALTYAYFASAFYDTHLWMPNNVPLGFHTGLEYQAHGNFFLRASWDPTLFFPFGRRSRANTTFLHQVRVELEGRADSGFGGGMALQFVHVGASGFVSNDAFQAAFEPFLGYESHKNFFMRAGWLVAIDEPLGFGFDRGRVASFRLTIGTQL